MTDPPGVPSALGIEAVEWFPHYGENLIVRITGRWRRRRPAWGGQPLLVIEAQGTRHRFPAIPEPPSLTGAAPGTWRMSFSVPEWLAPRLGGNAWLQLGAVVVPLPIGVESVAAPAPESTAPTPAAPDSVAPEPVAPESGAPEPAAPEPAAPEPAAPEAGAPEFAAQADPATDPGTLASRIEQLELALQQARREPELLLARLAERERERRAAEQRAHAERVLREELQDELARRARERIEDAEATGAVSALEEHVHELEVEIESLRRRADEAGELAAASRAARERAEREVGALTLKREQTARGPGAAEFAASRLRAELAVADRAPAAGSAASAGVVELSVKPSGLRSEREMIALREGSSASAAEVEGTGAALRLQLETRTASEGRARAMLAAAQARLDARSAVDKKLSSTLAELREELAELRTIAERESAGRAEAQAHAARLERELRDYETRFAHAYDAIEEMRGQLDGLRLMHAAQAPAAVPPAPPAAPTPLAPTPATDSAPTPPYPPTPAASATDSALAPPPPPATVEPERLAAALARLREAAPAEPAQPAPADRPEVGERAGRAAKGWLHRVFRALADRDGAAAGRLALALLPAQQLVHPAPLAYDLVLADVGCVQVTVASGAARVEIADAPRPPQEVHFQVTGDLASLARLLAAGRIRRRFGRGLASVAGDRLAFSALTALVRAPLHLRELHAAGVRMEPSLALSVVALMFDPSWTKGERFTIAHQEPGATGAGTYLDVRDGERPSVTETGPPGPVAATIVCPPDSLLAVLDGAARADVVVFGEERMLALVQSWVKHAQSG